MKKTVIFALCIMMMFVCGCQKKEIPIVEQPVTPEIPEELEITDVLEFESEKTPDVSPLAHEYFLEPIEEFSWEREFDVEKVVIHFTSAVVNFKDDPYNMDVIRNIFVDSGLSVHYMIDRGGQIYCYMPESRVAWHAGVGTYGDDEKYTNSMNKYSIGVELAAIGSQNDMAQYLHPAEYQSLDEGLIGFTDEQYESLKALVQDICVRNNIEMNKDNVIGHDSYNPKKTDPGELFDWGRLLEVEERK